MLVNPKGNGQREVTLEGDFVKLKGTQAPSVNDGSHGSQGDAEGSRRHRADAPEAREAPGASGIHHDDCEQLTIADPRP